MKITSNPKRKNILDTIHFAGKEILIRNLRGKKDVFNQIKKIHLDNKDRLKETKSKCEGILKEKEKKFLNELKTIFEVDLNNDKIVNINAFFDYNIANVIDGKNIFINIWSKDWLNYFLFHELVHLYYIDALENLKFKEINEAVKSPLMEGIDHLILFKTPIKKLFLTPNYEDVGFVVKNKKFMDELEEKWINGHSFNSFLKKAVKIQRKTKGVIIC
ncbi:MAG: hypothetical protein WC494_00490 [Candidatus Pacearchaeota archaeon]